MFPIKHHQYPIPSEQDIRMDILILVFLREELLLGNLSHVSLKEHYEQGVFSSETDCSWERFRRRALYQVGLGFTEPLVTYGPEGAKVDRRSYKGYLYPLRITPAGFMRIEELETELGKYEGLNRYVTEWKRWREKFIGMRSGAAIGSTLFLIVCIFVFDVKVSSMIAKIPLLNSVIDTKVLEEFEAINENDEFYQVAMDPKWISRINSPNIHETKEDRGLPPSEKSGVMSVSVRTVSRDEKVFRVVLEDGTIRYRQVKKEGDTYLISER